MEFTGLFANWSSIQTFPARPRSLPPSVSIFCVSLKKPLEGRRMQMEVEAQQSAVGFSSRERHLEFQLHFPVLKMTV
jgi:hypothetical protein